MLAINKYIFTLVVVGLTLIINSCVKDLNTNLDTTTKINSEWALPIANARLDLKNLIKNNENITTNPDGLVVLVYQQDSIFTQSVYDYTRIPNQQEITTTITVGSPLIDIDQNLGTFGGAKFKTLGLNTGLLNWQATNPASQTVDIELKLKNTTVGGSAANFVIQCTPGTSQGSINLNNLSIDLTQGNPAYNNLGFSFEVLNSNGAPNGTQLDFVISLSELRVEEAIGFFGEHKVALPSGRIETNLGVLSNIAEGFYLASPSVKLITTSNLGLPITINSKINGVSKSGKIESLDLQPFVFAGANLPGNLYQYDYVISPATSNISNFIANVPNEIIYSGEVKLNPAGETGNDNFADKTGFLSIGIEAELPLEFSTNNVWLQQTFYNINFGIDKEESEAVQNVTLGFKVENGFPFEADLFLYFLDSNQVILDSNSISLFNPANVDADGNVISPAKTIRYLDFDRTNIDNLLATKNLRIKVKMNTTGGNVVRILESYYIDLVIGTRVKLNYTLKP